MKQALSEGRPYATAFVDMRMPPGWDGVETIEHLWEADPNLQVVICTAFTDYTWEQTVARLGKTDRLLIVKKPFESLEIRQCACALSHKWEAHLRASLKFSEMQQMVLEVPIVQIFDFYRSLQPVQISDLGLPPHPT